MKTTKEAREIAARAVFGDARRYDVVIKVFVDTGEWRGPRCGDLRCESMAHRITEYGEQCAHAAVVEAT